MAWLEVETKVRIKDIKSMRKKVNAIARPEKKQIKEDNYFAIPRKKLGQNSYPEKAFRIRENQGKIEINFKKWLKNYWDKDIVVKKEFEVVLTNKHEAEDLIELFKDLGFVIWIGKVKNSESYIYKKDSKITIEVNNVKDLGWFLEIEYLCPSNEMNKAKMKIRQILKELEINPADIDNTGYTRMLWNKRKKL